MTSSEEIWEWLPMAGFIKVDVKKLPTQALNTQINKDIFYDFKVKCKQRSLPLNIVIEVFMNQYANRRYELRDTDIIKWKEDSGETETLNSTFNKEIYIRFKNVVKNDGHFVKHVISAFIEDYVNNDFTMEFLKEGD